MRVYEKIVEVLRLRKCRHGAWKSNPGDRPHLSLHVRLANRIIREAVGAHRFQLVDVAPVEDHWLFQQLLQMLEIRVAELVPFGNDEQGVGAVSLTG
jgi:hypothetical protein